MLHYFRKQSNNESAQNVKLLQGNIKGDVSDNCILSCGAVNFGEVAEASIQEIVTLVENDKDIFKYHSRLSITLSSIISEPNCLSYFVQYLEEKTNALSLIKFYLDTENFKNVALDDMRKKCTNYNSMQGNPIDKPEDCCSDVPELKTLCDISMHKPITDDEKSQICEETNKKLCIKNKASRISPLSVSCSLSRNKYLHKFVHNSGQICERSIQDALAIYQKYLIQNAPCYIKVPLSVLSTISLLLCTKSADEDKQTISDQSTITIDCFNEAQRYVLEQLEKTYLMNFLQSAHYSKYCLELVDSNIITIYDVLYSEVTLFHFMEYLEQHNERHCLDFWSSAINYRKGFFLKDIDRANEVRSDAMIIYEKFFSLQSDNPFWSCNIVRAYVESTICSDKCIYCFDVPLKMVAMYMEHKFLKNFLKSPLLGNYLSDLRRRIHCQRQENETESSDVHSNAQRVSLSRCIREKAHYSNRKTSSENTFDTKMFCISQKNTLLASMDNSSAGHLNQFKLDIDTKQLNDPQLLWHRCNSVNNNGVRNPLRFGHVNSFGRYERDFTLPVDVLNQNSSKYHNNWTIPLNGHKIKKAMRKLIHKPEQNVQEEIAWQMAEMIVKDVTNVTLSREARAKAANNE